MTLKEGTNPMLAALPLVSATTPMTALPVDLVAA